MGERRPDGEKEYNPLDDSLDLIGKVMMNQTSEFDTDSSKKELSEDRTEHHTKKIKFTRLNNSLRSQREEFVVFKFKVSRSDYQQAKKIVDALGKELDARIDLSNLARGWVTRLITAEKELIDAAQKQEKLKTPNLRNPLEVAEIDYAMTVVQSVAFGRATPIR